VQCNRLIGMGNVIEILLLGRLGDRMGRCAF
jgi:hypothetical protein